MRKLSGFGVLLIIIVAVVAFGFVATNDNPIIGKWLCDYSEDGGLVVTLKFTETEFYVVATADMETTEMKGTYELADNKIIMQTEEGENIEGIYDPEKDQVSGHYEGVLYVFDRIVEKE